MARALDLERIEVEERPGPAPSALVDAPAAPATPSAQEPKLERVSKASAPAAVAAGDTGEPDCDSLEDFDAWLECSEKVRLHAEHGWGV